MTAEIAVMNRCAVVFAADSAMTISATGKTYNSAEKIFDISSPNPTGLILYNALDYMGMALDVLIKDFRESPYCKPFAMLEEAPEAFFEYLTREFRVMGEDEDIHVDSLVTSVYSVVHRRFMRAISQGKEPPSYQEVFIHR